MKRKDWYFQGFGIFLWSGDFVCKPLWAVGWETGRDSDLICVRPNIKDTHIIGDRALSPTSTSRFLALLGFILKFILLAIDDNFKSLIKK